MTVWGLWKPGRTYFERTMFVSLKYRKLSLLVASDTSSWHLEMGAFHASLVSQNVDFKPHWNPDILHELALCIISATLKLQVLFLLPPKSVCIISALIRVADRKPTGLPRRSQCWPGPRRKGLSFQPRIPYVAVCATGHKHSYLCVCPHLTSETKDVPPLFLP